MFSEIKNFLSNDECDEIINKCGSLIKEHKVGIEFNRQGNTVKFQDHEELKEIDQLVFTRLSYFLKNKLEFTFALQGYNVADSGYSFHRYKHTDQLFTHADGLFCRESEIFYPRVLSCVINLTDNDNADLIFPRHNKSIKSEKGKLVSFLPHPCFEHYMNNYSGKNRDVIVTWLEDRSTECREANKNE
jgi:hypothetical protein